MIAPHGLGEDYSATRNAEARRSERIDRPSHGALLAYLVLFAALYAAFGVQSPYLPRLLQDHGLGAEAIGTVLAAGTAIRLAAGPAAGYLADRLDAARLVFAGCAAAAAVAAIVYLPARGFWPLLAVSLAQASALAPLAPLCDSRCSPLPVREGTASITAGCAALDRAPSSSERCYRGKW